MALIVEVPGDPRRHLVDVGFGAAGALLEPIPLTPDTAFDGAGRRHRLVHAPHHGPLELWVLEQHTAGSWQPQYAFTLEPFERPDFEVINWHTATNPRSPFSALPYAQRVTPDRHLLLHGTRLTETRADGTTTERDLTDEDDARRVLEEQFDIAVPEGTPWKQMFRR
jgi:N-hydroxyarylamine O-acetyltransferase